MHAGECSEATPLKIYKKTRKQPKAAELRTKRHMLSIIRDVAKLSVYSGDFGHNILSPKKL